MGKRTKLPRIDSAELLLTAQAGIAESFAMRFNLSVIEASLFANRFLEYISKHPISLPKSLTEKK